jgi:hypothetical protein
MFFLALWPIADYVSSKIESEDLQLHSYEKKNLLGEDP